MSKRVAAEQAASDLGATFVIRSSRENSWALIENLEFLRDYKAWKPQNDVSQIARLHERIACRPWSTIASVLNRPLKYPSTGFRPLSQMT